MKKILAAGFCLAAPCLGWAEVVQSVNFNPARFGQYERLKVSDKATFTGGLSAQSMRVQSGGTVTINESPSNGQSRLAYDILKLDATKGFLSNENDFPGNPTLNFPNTCFGSLENCVTSSATGNLEVSFQNGKARFQAPASYTDNASRINQITTQANQLRIEAIYATIKGKLNVTGAGTYSFRNMGADTPLRLAGNWVPLPSADGAPQNATLKWENRTTVKYADHGGETVRILVLDGGTAGGCSPTNGNSYTGTCPAGQTGSITYTWNQAQCKYLQTANTCTTGGCTGECSPGETTSSGCSFGQKKTCSSSCTWSTCKCVLSKVEESVKAACQQGGNSMWNESECGCRCCNKGSPYRDGNVIMCSGSAPMAAYLCVK